MRQYGNTSRTRPASTTVAGRRSYGNTTGSAPLELGKTHPQTVTFFDQHGEPISPAPAPIVVPDLAPPQRQYPGAAIPVPGPAYGVQLPPNVQATLRWKQKQQAQLSSAQLTPGQRHQFAQSMQLQQLDPDAGATLDVRVRQQQIDAARIAYQQAAAEAAAEEKKKAALRGHMRWVFGLVLAIVVIVLFVPKP